MFCRASIVLITKRQSFTSINSSIESTYFITSSCWWVLIYSLKCSGYIKSSEQNFCSPLQRFKNDELSVPHCSKCQRGWPFDWKPPKLCKRAFSRFWRPSFTLFMFGKDKPELFEKSRGHRQCVLDYNESWPGKRSSSLSKNDKIPVNYSCYEYKKECKIQYMQCSKIYDNHRAWKNSITASRYFTQWDPRSRA